MSNDDNLANNLTPPQSSDDYDLDDLLDSALDDFNALNLSKSKITEGVVGVQGLGLGLPDLSKKKAKPKAKENKPHVSEALDKLRAHTQEAVKGLGSSSTDEPAIEDWVNQFQELAGSQDMESIMETMMQQLLSKEILQKPMKEIGEKYPEWLEGHRGSVSPEDFERFSKQNELISSLNRVYDEEPTNFDKIFDLMQRMQECGQPPSDILDQIAPDFAAQLSPEMLDPQTNCSIM